MVETAPAPTGHVWHGGCMIPYFLDDRRNASPRPAILVVIPYYNAAPWIDECLAKLRANDEAHDILLIDDGSSPAFAIDGATDNLVICRFGQNAGLITALNFAAGFAVSQGYTYYVRQDADDMSRPTRLKSQLETIQRENADLVVSGVRAVDQEGTTVWRGTMTTDGDLFRKTLATRNPTVHSTWFLRTDTFTKIGCYDERFKGAEDFELLQRIARQGTIAFVPDELVDYLVRTGSVLSASRGPALQTLRILAYYFDGSNPRSYLGLLRATGAAMASRRLKTFARRFLQKPAS